MTRRSSLRAQAREIYRDLAAKKTADPPSPEGFGGQAAQNLTEKVRALYEDSAVPVREIAAIAGVTERTIYKYARKQQWKPRYRWRARGQADRGRRWRQRPGFAPVKGAGARFIRRADSGPAGRYGPQGHRSGWRRARRRKLRGGREPVTRSAA